MLVNFTIRMVLILVLSSHLISCGQDQSAKSDQSLEANPIILVSSLRAKGNSYGAAIRFSPDGMTLAISESQGDLTAFGNDIGLVFIYNKNADGSGWIKHSTLRSGTPGMDFNFGSELSFSPDGQFLAVAETHAGYQQNSLAGNVQIFDKNKNWANVKTLLSNLPTMDNLFGSALSFSPDGKVLAVGIARNNLVDRARLGKVNLYETANGSWAYLSSISSNNPTVGSFFGDDLSFSPDSKTLAVAERFGDALKINDAGGNVQLFSLDATNAWIHQQTLLWPILNIYNQFGSSVRFNPVDSSLVVGEKLGDTVHSPNSGVVHIFYKNGQTWEPVINAPLVSNIPSKGFGNLVRFSPDGKILAISEIGGTAQGQEDADLVKLYRKSLHWQWSKTLQSKQPSTGNFFGNSFSFSADSQTIAIAERLGDDADLADIGKVHIFELD